MREEGPDPSVQDAPAQEAGETQEAEKPAVTPRERFGALLRGVQKSGELPPLPGVATRALMLARDPRTRAQDLVRVVSSDAAFATRVLRISRSATYIGRREPAHTVGQAIATIGFDAVCRTLVAASARSAYVVGDPVAERLWSHALATALAADELARSAGEPPGGDSFLAGLLHDIGKLIFHLADAGAFSQLDHSDERGERRVYGVSHEYVGAQLVKDWGLDVRISNAIGSHHERPIRPGLSGRLAQADWVAHEIGYGSVNGVILPVKQMGQNLVDLSKRVATRFEAEKAFFD